VPPRPEPSELRRRFADAFRPRPLLYWADLLASAGCGWTLLALGARAAAGSPLQLAASAGAVLALLRAALFLHELAHRRPGTLPGFELAWNALVGIPIAVPSLMYVGSHPDHHRPSLYGTDADPEYAPIARWSRARIALSVLALAAVPLLLPLRWALAGPASRAVRALRPLVVGRLSTLAINPRYVRPAPRGRDAARWRAQETAAALFWGAALAALAAGLLPARLALEWYAVVAGVFVLNQVRTLAAHRYESPGDPIDTEAQLLDSISLGGPWLSALAAPVGLRFHALHHHLPALPYHSLGRVHRALLAELPADSPYRRTLRPGLWPALHGLWRRASASP
jgi:fatty acid desaturase